MGPEDSLQDNAAQTLVLSSQPPVAQLLNSRDQLPERILCEHYELKRLLGEGTYGQVYLAKCKQTNKMIALKQLSMDKVKFKDFKRELNYSYFLSAHPSIVSTYAVAFTAQSKWVFAQELCTTGDLLDSINPGRGIGEQATKTVIRQVVQALSFMHSNKLCHRDVKPENLLLFDRETWTVKLMDFGLTCRCETTVRRSSGNTPYTPPEVCQVICNEGFSAHTSTDVWQAAITLYCLLTGSFPWDEAYEQHDSGYQTFTLWYKKRSYHCPSRWVKFSEKLLKLFRKMLNPVPDERCSIGSVNKYLGEVWVRSSDGNEVDYETNDEAKLELQNTLCECGIPTKVTKQYKTARIAEWVKSHNGQY